MESKFDCHWKGIKTWVGMDNSPMFFRRLSNTHPQNKGGIPALILASVGLIKSTMVILNGRKENGMVTTTKETYSWLSVS